MTEPRQLFYRQHYKLYEKNQGAADLETEGFMGRTLIGALRHWDGSYRTFTDMDTMLEEIINTPMAGGRNPNRHTSGIVWFHNWAKFDGARFVEAIFDLIDRRPDIQASLIPQGGTKFIAVRLQVPQDKKDRPYNVIIADSFAVHPSSLKKMAEALAPDLPKLGTCPRHDFTATPPVWFSPACPDCMAYLQRDVDTLLACMTRTEALLHQVFRSPLAITAGSIAWKAALATVPRGKAYWRESPRTEAWLRPAVHGGLVWPGHKRGDRGIAVAYDISGAYAATLREGVPYGETTYRRVYRNDLPGVWDATVTVPHDIPIPILCGPPDCPVMPTGTFRHKFTNLEIDYAEKFGCTFIIHEGITWAGYEFPFNPFIDKCENIEYPADGSKCDPAMKSMVKLGRNSLPGRTAMKPDMIKYRLGTDPGEGEVTFTDPISGDLLPVIGTPEKVSGAWVNPHFNIFVTARQRIKIHKILIAGGEGAYYADTDSIYCAPLTARLLINSGTINVGQGYGMMHEEGTFTSLVVAGPKNKMAVDRDGKRYFTAKGIPLKHCTEEKHRAAAQGIVEDVTFESSISFKSRLTDPEKPYGLIRTRGYSVLEHSSSWTVDEHDNIRPRRAS